MTIERQEYGYAHHRSLIHPWLGSVPFIEWCMLAGLTSKVQMFTFIPQQT
jgi:hypothetical protein